MENSVGDAGGEQSREIAPVPSAEPAKLSCASFWTRVRAGLIDGAILGFIPAILVLMSAGGRDIQTYLIGTAILFAFYLADSIFVIPSLCQFLYATTYVLNSAGSTCSGGG